VGSYPVIEEGGEERYERKFLSPSRRGDGFWMGMG